MERQELRIGVTGRIGNLTAHMLGGWIEEADDGFELVAPYLDQAQVTGLLIHLDDLHIAFHRVTVSTAAKPTTTPISPAETTLADQNNEGARR